MSGELAAIDPVQSYAQIGALPNMVEGYRSAATALSEMQRHRILPTPRAYELWLAFRSNTNPALTKQMLAILKSPEGLTPATIDCLREEYGIDSLQHDAEPDSDMLLGLSATLSDAAQSLIDQTKSGGAAIHAFGDALARGAADLGTSTGWDEAVRVIGMLTASTKSAFDRNAALESQLNATTEKVGKLQRLLLAKRKAASTDQLTGLASRREFDLRLRRKLRKTAVDPSIPASLLMLDIDHFKRFNDTYGHRAGDLVLRLVGRLLIESIKGRDLAARYGGEEFAILLIGADLDDAAEIARQICATLALKRLNLSNGSERGRGRVSMSIGVAQFRVSDTTATVVDRADAALYAAKHAGRNRVMTERALLGEGCSAQPN